MVDTELVSYTYEDSDDLLDKTLIHMVVGREN